MSQDKIIDVGGSMGSVETDNGSLGMGFKKVVEKNGRLLVLPEIGEGKSMDYALDENTRRYFLDALHKMPYILAVHATLNMESPDLSEISKGVIPIVGLEAPPRTGKTMMLLLTELENEGKIGVWDWDTFSPQAFSKMKLAVNDLMGTVNKNDAGKVFGILRKVIEGSLGEIQERDEVSLAEKLDSAVLDYLKMKKEGGGPLAILVDLPGVDEGNRKPDVFDWMRSNMPVIRIKRDMEMGDMLGPENERKAMGWFYEMYRQIKEGLGVGQRVNDEDKQDGFLPIEWAGIYQMICVRSVLGKENV